MTFLALPRQLSVCGLLAAVVIGLVAGAACDQGPPDCPEGSEGCPCNEALECLGGLSCRSYFCVDLSWTPGPKPGGRVDASHDDSQHNVAACEAFVDALECGNADLTRALACDEWSALDCDVAAYFDCLRDEFRCELGQPDVQNWEQCTALGRC